MGPVFVQPPTNLSWIPMDCTARGLIGDRRRRLIGECSPHKDDVADDEVDVEIEASVDDVADDVADVEIEAGADVVDNRIRISGGTTALCVVEATTSAEVAVSARTIVVQNSLKAPTRSASSANRALSFRSERVAPFSPPGTATAPRLDHDWIHAHAPEARARDRSATATA